MTLRKAQKKDIYFILEMIAEDPLGKFREDFRDPIPIAYLEAFQKIEADKNQELIVLVNDKKDLIGCFQLSFIQYLTYKGGIRAQIEGVRIKKDHRGRGLGKIMFEWAINRSKERGAHLLQLTTDKKRPKAIKFYEDLGFQSSHEGMKLHF